MSRIRTFEGFNKQIKRNAKCKVRSRIVVILDVTKAINLPVL